jgi:Zn-dependent protease with chaperone function
LISRDSKKISHPEPEDSAASIVMSTHPSAADRLAQLEAFAGTLDRFQLTTANWKTDL